MLMSRPIDLTLREKSDDAIILNSTGQLTWPPLRPPMTWQSLVWHCWGTVEYRVHKYTRRHGTNRREWIIHYKEQTVADHVSYIDPGLSRKH